MRTTTGDSAKSINTKAVSLLNVGIVLKTDLEDDTHFINQTVYSGKQKGGLIVATDADGTNPVLYMASGGLPADDWIAQGGGASYTLPNATTAIRGGVLQSAATPDQAALTVAGADVAALVTSTNTALAALVAKINAILAAERTAGQKA